MNRQKLDFPTNDHTEQFPALSHYCTSNFALIDYMYVFDIYDYMHANGFG